MGRASADRAGLRSSRRLYSSITIVVVTTALAAWSCSPQMSGPGPGQVVESRPPSRPAEGVTTLEATTTATQETVELGFIDVDVPYVSQHIGLRNQCVPAVMAIVSPYYGLDHAPTNPDENPQLVRKYRDAIAQAFPDTGLEEGVSMWDMASVLEETHPWMEVVGLMSWNTSLVCDTGQSGGRSCRLVPRRDADSESLLRLLYRPLANGAPFIVSVRPEKLRTEDGVQPYDYPYRISHVVVVSGLRREGDRWLVRLTDPLVPPEDRTDDYEVTAESSAEAYNNDRAVAVCYDADG